MEAAHLNPVCGNREDDGSLTASSAALHIQGRMRPFSFASRRQLSDWRPDLCPASALTLENNEPARRQAKLFQKNV